MNPCIIIDAGVVLVALTMARFLPVHILSLI